MAKTEQNNKVSRKRSSCGCGISVLSSVMQRDPHPLLSSLLFLPFFPLFIFFFGVSLAYCPVKREGGHCWFLLLLFFTAPVKLRGLEKKKKEKKRKRTRRCITLIFLLAEEEEEKQTKRGKERGGGKKKKEGNEHLDLTTTPSFLHSIPPLFFSPFKKEKKNKEGWPTEYVLLLFFFFFLSLMGHAC